MDKENQFDFCNLSPGLQLQTQDSLLEIKKRKKSLCIGVPTEHSLQEKRVALTPGAVEVLVNNGHEVRVETEAGLACHYPDNEYSDAGAQIVYSSKEAFESSIIVKIEPPTVEELSYMKPESLLISALQTGGLSQEYLAKINKKKLTAIAFELFEDKTGELPFMRSMSEIAGKYTMTIAAQHLDSSDGGKGLLLGGITGVVPTKIIILGAGTVAEHASRAAIGLGAEVQIFDNNLYKLRRLQNLVGQQLFTSTLDSRAMAFALKEADVVIGTIRPQKGRNRYWVTEELVAQMQKGSVIIDVSIDQGGCFETSRLTTIDKPSYKMFDVVHYCVPNIPSIVARTATKAISHIFTPILLEIADRGGVDEMIFSGAGFMKGVYSYKGHLTNQEIANTFNLKFKDLSLFIATRF